MRELIEALKCSATPGGCTVKKCMECKYHFEEVIEDDDFLPDYEKDGKKMYVACDCDGMVLEAARIIEKIAGIIEKDCPENNECSECLYNGEAECISHRKYVEIMEVINDNRRTG